MSDRGSGLGPFMLGVAVGALLGFLFAPEPGEETRRRLSGQARRLRELAGEKAEELGELLEGEAGAGLSAREELARRLEDARRRRRAGRGGGGRRDAEEDEPVA